MHSLHSETDCSPLRLGGMMISSQILSDRHACGYLTILTGLLLLVALVCVGMSAQPSLPSSPSVKSSAPSAVVPTQSAPTHELTAVDLEAFLDGLMPRSEERRVGNEG